MNVSDPIADMLTRIRNGVKSKKREVNIPASRLGVEVVKILKEEGYIADYNVTESSPQDVLEITLKYGTRKERTITGLRRISKPGLRVYAKKDELPRVLGGLGVAVISTSHGVMTDREARQQGVGGEVDAGRNGAAQILPVLRKRIEGCGRAKVHDAGRAAVELHHRRRIAHPVSADGARVFVADADAGLDARFHHQRLAAQVFTAGLHHAPGQLRHHGCQADPL